MPDGGTDPRLESSDMRSLGAALVLSFGGLAMTLAPAAAGPDAPLTSETSSEAAARQARGGSLASSPAAYVGGQALTFTGSLGVPGVRRITLAAAHEPTG